jgi:hypothetical protein
MKKFEISSVFDDVEFWIKDEKNNIIPEDKIKHLLIEMVLETTG